MALTTASQAPQQPLQHLTKLHRGVQKSRDKKHSARKWPSMAPSALNTTIAKDCGCIAQPKVVPMQLLSVPISALHTTATWQRAEIVRPTKQPCSASIVSCIWTATINNSECRVEGDSLLAQPVQIVVHYKFMVWKGHIIHTAHGVHFGLDALNIKNPTHKHSLQRL